MTPSRQKVPTLEKLETDVSSHRLTRNSLLAYLRQVPNSEDALDKSDRVFFVLDHSIERVLNVGDFDEVSKICLAASNKACALNRERGHSSSVSLLLCVGGWNVRAEHYTFIARAIRSLIDLNKETIPADSTHRPN
jgi:hypothetical protein